jgi:asparagine synthase (glutamine-hydrolysing)
MFAFAFFNKRKNTVSLGRDPLGKKPLFYSSGKQELVWGSSIWNVSKLSDSSIRKTSDFGTYHYLGYEVSPTTHFSKVFELNPGVCATFDLTSYTQNFQTKFKTSQVSKSASIRQSLLEAVEKRIKHHSEIAISLSGGLDSTIIAILVKELGVGCTTFSANWNDSDKSRYNSDGVLAREISKKLGFDHNQVEMLNTSELETEIRNYLIAMEEPNSNPTGVSMMKLYGAISKHGIRLTLTGDGADEIFSGYERYNLVAGRKNLFQLKNPMWERYVLAKRDSMRRFPTGLLASQMSPRNASSWLYWHLIFTPSEWNEIRITKNNVSTEIAALDGVIQKISPVTELSNPIQIMMKRDSDIWLSMESNKRLDRISMFHSIEARSPFQDDNLVKYANQKMQESGFKRLDKKILRNEFPEVEALGIMKGKVGFISPVGHWMRKNPELIDSSFAILDSAQEFNMNRLQRLRNEALDGNFRKISQIWNLIIYAQWIKIQQEDI